MTTTTEEPWAPIIADFKLDIARDDRGASEAYVPVSWCLTPEARQELRNRNAVRPQMVLIVTSNRGHGNSNHWDITDVVATDLKDGMAYVRFVYAGSNRVLGVICWNCEGDVQKLSKAIFSGGQLDYYTEAPTVSPMYLREQERLPFVADLEVLVPDEMFAKEPPRLLQAIVRMYFKRKEVDQCHFRRRLILSLLYSPIYFGLGTIIRLLQLVVCLFIGYRKINYAAVVRQVKYDVLDVSEDAVDGRKTWWSHNKHGAPRDLWWWFLQPISYTLVWGILFGISNVHVTRGTGENEYVEDNWGWGALDTLFVSIGVHVAILAVCGVVALIVLGVSALNLGEKVDALDKRHNATQSERLERESAGACLTRSTA